MNVKDAVKVAINQVGELFESENVSNLGLEEVTYDNASKEWLVTVGFSRPWDYSKTPTLAAMVVNQPSQPKRSFKLVIVRDSDHQVVSIKNRASES